MRKITREIKGSILTAGVYFLLALGCIIIATEMELSNVWHDAFLVIGGIFAGGFCAIATIVKIESAKELPSSGKE